MTPTFVFLLVAVASGSVAPVARGALPPQEPTTPARPNILLIVADDHAYQAVGAYGSVLNATPSIDRIADGGIRFERALVTNSLCAPSRAAILTGLYGHANGVRDNVSEFDGRQPTLPKMLRTAGYQTAAFGKWHLKSEPTGFDRWEVLPGQGHYYNPDLRTPEGTVRREGYVSDIVTDLTLDWLREERDPERPFFVWLGHKAPHRNWMPGPEHLRTYAEENFPEPKTLFDDYATRVAADSQEMEIDRHMTLAYDLKVRPAGPETAQWEQEFWEGMDERMTEAQRAEWNAAYDPRNREFLADPPTGDDLVRWKYNEYLKDYLATIASIDDNVGRLLDYLDESGLADNTLVVYTSDQGFYLGEHGWYDKRWIYEESLRTPMVMRWPGVIAPGSSSGELVSNVDLTPTFLEAAGLPEPDGLHGRSFAPILRGEAEGPHRDAFYYHYYEADGPHAVPLHYGVVTHDYKLIRYPELDAWELFERATDPHEIRNRHGDPELAEVQERLEQELERLRRELDVR